MIQPPPWNTCEFVFQFIFVIPHIPGKMNTVADFILGLEVDPSEKLFLKTEEDRTIKLIEINIETTGIAPQKDTLQNRQWAYRNPRARQSATQSWNLEDQIPSSSRQNNRFQLSHWPTQGTVSCKSGIFQQTLTNTNRTKLRSQPSGLRAREARFIIC